MCVNWNSFISQIFGISKGVKPGDVLSPMFFNIYLEQLIFALKELLVCVGYHVHGMTVAVFSYAGEVTLLLPTSTALNVMLTTCTVSVNSHDLFNSSGRNTITFYG